MLCSVYIQSWSSYLEIEKERVGEGKGGRESGRGRGTEGGREGGEERKGERLASDKVGILSVPTGKYRKVLHS